MSAVLVAIAAVLTPIFVTLVPMADALVAISAVLVPIAAASVAMSPVLVVVLESLSFTPVATASKLALTSAATAGVPDVKELGMVTFDAIVTEPLKPKITAAVRCKNDLFNVRASLHSKYQDA